MIFRKVSHIHKNFTFEKEQIVILMANVRNDEVIIPLEHENMSVRLQDTNTIYPELELDYANEVEPEDPQPQVPEIN